jgi:hypothetical protein
MPPRKIEATRMKTDVQPTEASLRYAAAHSLHHESKNLREALELYGGVLADHPNAPEAGYSRVQMRNIVDAVVPEATILDVLVQLAVARLAPGAGALQVEAPRVALHGRSPAGASR